MRIVYLHQYFTTPDQGGSTRSYEFARRWVEAGHEVHVLCIGAGHSEARGWGVEQVSGITVHTLKLAYSNRMGFYRRLAAFGGYALAAVGRVRRLHPDVVFATSTPLTVAIPALASARRGTPYVFEVRDVWPDVPIALGYLRNPILRAAAISLEGAAYRHAGQVVVLAPGMKEDIVRKGVPSEKISVIPQGCDRGIFQGANARKVRSENSWLGDGPVFLYAGAIGQANGLTYLIDLAAAMKKVVPSAQFVVLGDGKERKALEDEAQARGLLGVSVFFLGRRTKLEVAEWMTASDASLALLMGPRVLWKDAVQNKFFDSLAAERPIATNNDGWQTQIAVEEGVGRMLDPNDPSLAARQLADMVQDRAWMDAVPANCRRLAEHRFNRDKQSEEALQLVVRVALAGGVRTRAAAASGRVSDRS